MEAIEPTGVRHEARALGFEHLPDRPVTLLRMSGAHATEMAQYAPRHGTIGPAGD